MANILVRVCTRRDRYILVVAFCRHQHHQEKGEIMAGQIIVQGKLDYADGAYLITVKRPFKTRYLGYYIHAYIGKTITISLEEKEEEPALTHNLAVALAGA